ncbi:MAG: NAD-dependent epimerase/dehydratase family protein [Acidimicrobiia bacterium]|nr:NAD-dependent epimerase/dehydratase family protein [Acidimicrobiia bacterium]
MDPLAEDLDGVLDATRDLWRDLVDARILITGGTGFFGSWLLESFAWANDRLQLGSSGMVLTRDPEAFAAKAPHLADHEAIRFVRGDVRDLPSDLGKFDAVIHAATSASADLNRTDPMMMLDTIVDGTRRVLDTAAASGAIPVLLTSSGAVYGRQPPEIDRMPETWTGGPDPLDPGSAYAEGKRLAELCGVLFASSTDLQVKHARCYAFVGPYLPLDRHFAIGNFIRDGLAGRPIRIQGDGTTVRSYLYAADLAVWLWTVLLRGETGRAYNVGSEESTDIAGLARTVAGALDPVPAVEIEGRPRAGPIDRYVPSTERARTELGLEQRVSLSEGIARTVAWHRAR